jgi:hypothetical protein
MEPCNTRLITKYRNPEHRDLRKCAFVAVGDWSTGRATVSIDPDVPARDIWQAVRRNGGNLAYYLRHGTDGFTSPPKEVVLRIFITLKNPSTSVGIGRAANLGSSGEHANH